MPAYLVMDIDWHDPERANEYRRLLGPTLDQFGAKTLVANTPEVLEGDWKPKRLVVIEFPTMKALHEWHASKEYAPLIELRRAGGRSNMLAVEPPAKA